MTGFLSPMRTGTQRSLALAILAACGGQVPPPTPAAPPPAETFRAAAPTPGPAPVLRAPVPVRSTLDNGATLLVVPKGDLPLIHVQILVRTGSANDPAAQPGLAGFLGDVMRAGTTSRSAEQIADEMETLGTSVSIGVGVESSTLSWTTTTENFAAALAVASDVLLRPAFAKKEIERVRRGRLAGLLQTEDDARATADRVFRKVIYPQHPYGHTSIGERAAIERVDQAALRAFHRQHIQPQLSAIIVVGDITPERAQEVFTSALGSTAWPKGTTAAPQLAAAAQPAQQRVFVHKQASPQSQLRLGHIGVERHHPEYFNLIIMNAILGGLFTSRINMNLREDKGYTYGARSSFDFWQRPGPFSVACGVRTDATLASIQEIIKEVRTIREHNVTDKELDDAKSKYRLGLPGNFETISDIGGMMATLFLFDLPLDYYQSLPDRIAAVTVADVRRVAASHLDPDKLSVVVVGDRNQTATPLAELGTFTELTPSGIPEKR